MLRPQNIAAVLISASCMTFGGITSATAEPPTYSPVMRGVVFTGYEHMQGSDYELAGMIVAFNGDLGKNGFALRAYGARMDYDLDPGEGRGWQGDLMLGYLFSRGNFGGGIFVGVDYQNYKLKPDDPTAAIRGTELGLKIAANLGTDSTSPHYFDISASYSTSFSSYWARIRTGLNHQGFAFGPEGIVMGSEGFDAQRLGGFVSYKFPNRPVELTFSSGYQFLSGSGQDTSTSGGEGIYAGVNLAIGF